MQTLSGPFKGLFKGLFQSCPRGGTDTCRPVSKEYPLESENKEKEKHRLVRILWGIANSNSVVLLISHAVHGRQLPARAAFYGGYIRQLKLPSFEDANTQISHFLGI
jgi:hypothetical protein